MDNGVRISDSSTSIIHGENATITIEQDEKITIRRTGNHNEISIMENDWKQIKRKIDLMSFSRKPDISMLLYGAMIPYIIDVLGALISKNNPNYWPIFICVVLVVLRKVLSRYVPFLQENPVEEDLVHLADLKNIVEQIDVSSQV